MSEHVDELGRHIEGLIRDAKTKQEIALADYRSGVDAERKAKEMRDELKALERAAQPREYHTDTYKMVSPDPSLAGRR